VAQKLRYILDADKGLSIFRRLLLSPKGAMGESNKVVEAPLLKASWWENKLPYFSRGFVRRWKAHLRKALTIICADRALSLVIASVQRAQGNPIETVLPKRFLLSGQEPK